MPADSFRNNAIAHVVDHSPNVPLNFRLASVAELQAGISGGARE
jgi:hypothetical protein